MHTKIVKDQSGQVLLLVTFTLVIAIILLPAILLFIGGAGRTAQIREDRMLQVYAADAGIEKAFHQIVLQSPALPGNVTDDPWLGNITGINDNDVDIKVYKGDGKGVYRILSTATDWEGTSTTIESYTSAQGQGFIFDNALTSYDDITLKSNVEIVGNISLNGDEIGQGWGEYNNRDKVTGEPVVNWPKPEDLIPFYQADVGGDCDTSPYLYNEGNISVSGYQTAGPLLRCGDLVIDALQPLSYLTLTDTVYITGNFDIPSYTQEFYLDLGNQTIFCEGEVFITGKCHITGNGCIVALGDVNYNPDFGTNPDCFVFIISVTGTLWTHPQGTLYGSLAGYEEIQVFGGSGAKVEWVDYEGIGFFPNFPTEDDEILPAIITYTILDGEPEL